MTEYAPVEVMKAGKRVLLRFQETWLREYEWLTYSPSQGGAYCRYCVFFAKLKKGFLGTLVKSPFRNYKKAKGKDGYLDIHNSADYHHEAMLQGKAFLQAFQKPEIRIDSLLEKERRAISDTNKHILGVIVDTVSLCGMQGLPLRGHRDDNTADPNTNRGVFLAILEHTAKSDPRLYQHLTLGKKSQRYTSKTVQNEVINIIADHLRQRILEPLKLVRYFSVMADEVTDHHANQEILSLCVRFVDLSDGTGSPHVKEAFLDFIHLERATAQGVADAILGLMTKHGLDVQDLRGQSFDGASALAGEKNGTQAIIRRANPLALYTHCRSHVLSLSIGKACAVEAIHQMIDVINEIYLFFNLSPKRQRFLELTLEIFAPDSRVTKLKGLCKTRWTERHDCLETMRALYEYIVTCLDAMLHPAEYPDVVEAGGDSWSWDATTRTKAEGLKHSLKHSRNIVALIILVNGLDVVKGLATKLQKRDADVAAAYKLIDAAMSDVRSMRENVDLVWEDWYQEAESIAADVGAEISMPRQSKHQRHRPNTPADTAR